jgi:hypothetical protein
LAFDDVVTSAELPEEGGAPARQVPGASGTAVTGPPAHGDVEPRVSCTHFAMGLPEVERGGFLAYCRMHEIDNVRRTADGWREIMRQHMTRAIR